MAGFVHLRQARQHGSQADAAQHEGGNADEEWRPALRADGKQAERPGREAGRDIVE